VALSATALMAAMAVGAAPAAAIVPDRTARSPFRWGGATPADNDEFVLYDRALAFVEVAARFALGPP